MCSKVRVNIAKAPAFAPTAKAKGARCAESVMGYPVSTRVVKSENAHPAAAQVKRNDNSRTRAPSLNSYQTELRLF